MKIRVIPTILTDGLTVVKGEKFNNWRTVGSAEATARLYSRRDVDELMFLDVTARARRTTIDIDLLKHFTNLLDIPFCVGGGINTLDEARTCFRQGAERVVLGTAAILNPNLITEIAEVFGNQAVIVAIDFEADQSSKIRIESGQRECDVPAFEFIEKLESLGVGEILLQSIQRDGCLEGMDFERIKRVSSISKLPIIASGGAASNEDCLKAVKSGASAVSVGALFQFTDITPRQVKNYLSSQGISTRISE